MDGTEASHETIQKMLDNHQKSNNALDQRKSEIIRLIYQLQEIEKHEFEPEYHLRNTRQPFRHHSPSNQRPLTKDVRPGNVDLYGNCKAGMRSKSPRHRVHSRRNGRNSQCRLDDSFTTSLDRIFTHHSETQHLSGSDKMELRKMLDWWRNSRLSNFEDRPQTPSTRHPQRSDLESEKLPQMTGLRLNMRNNTLPTAPRGGFNRGSFSNSSSQNNRLPRADVASMQEQPFGSMSNREIQHLKLLLMKMIGIDTLVDNKSKREYPKESSDLPTYGCRKYNRPSAVKTSRSDREKSSGNENGSHPPQQPRTPPEHPRMCCRSGLHFSYTNHPSKLSGQSVGSLASSGQGNDSTFSSTASLCEDSATGYRRYDMEISNINDNTMESAHNTYDKDKEVNAYDRRNLVLHQQNEFDEDFSNNLLTFLIGKCLPKSLISNQFRSTHTWSGEIRQEVLNKIEEIEVAKKIIREELAFRDLLRKPFKVHRGDRLILNSNIMYGEAVILGIRRGLPMLDVMDLFGETGWGENSPRQALQAIRQACELLGEFYPDSDSPVDIHRAAVDCLHKLRRLDVVPDMRSLSPLGVLLQETITREPSLHPRMFLEKFVQNINVFGNTHIQIDNEEYNSPKWEVERLKNLIWSMEEHMAVKAGREQIENKYFHGSRPNSANKKHFKHKNLQHDTKIAQQSVSHEYRGTPPIENNSPTKIAAHIPHTKHNCPFTEQNWLGVEVERFKSLVVKMQAKKDLGTIPLEESHDGYSSNKINSRPPSPALAEVAVCSLQESHLKSKNIDTLNCGEQKHELQGENTFSDRSMIKGTVKSLPDFPANVHRKLENDVHRTRNLFDNMEHCLTKPKVSDESELSQIDYSHETIEEKASNIPRNSNKKSLGNICSEDLPNKRDSEETAMDTPIIEHITSPEGQTIESVHLLNRVVSCEKNVFHVQENDRGVPDEGEEYSMESKDSKTVGGVCQIKNTNRETCQTTAEDNSSEPVHSSPDSEAIPQEDGEADDTHHSTTEINLTDTDSFEGSTTLDDVLANLSALLESTSGMVTTDSNPALSHSDFEASSSVTNTIESSQQGAMDPNIATINKCVGERNGEPLKTVISNVTGHIAREDSDDGTISADLGTAIPANVKKSHTGPDCGIFDCGSYIVQRNGSALEITSRSSMSKSHHSTKCSCPQTSSSLFLDSLCRFCKEFDALALKEAIMNSYVATYEKAINDALREILDYRPNFNPSAKHMGGKDSVIENKSTLDLIGDHMNDNKSKSENKPYKRVTIKDCSQELKKTLKQTSDDESTTKKDLKRTKQLKNKEIIQCNMRTTSPGTDCHVLVNQNRHRDCIASSLNNVPQNSKKSHENNSKKVTTASKLTKKKTFNKVIAADTRLVRDSLANTDLSMLYDGMNKAIDIKSKEKPYFLNAKVGGHSNPAKAVETPRNTSKTPKDHRSKKLKKDIPSNTMAKQKPKNNTQ